MVSSMGQEKVLITRLLVMFAVGAGASIFWIVQRDRRAEAVKAQLDILQAGLSEEAGPSAGSGRNAQE
jgi:flagellar basal body-associated protein FliL